MKRNRCLCLFGVLAVAFLALAAVAEDTELLRLRREQAAQLNAARQRYEAAASRPGANQAALIESYRVEQQRIRSTFNELDPRAANIKPLTEHPAHQIRSTGGSREPVPANVNADIDLSSQAKDPAARAAADAAARQHMTQGGTQPVYEDPSKIVDPRTDTTYWKQDSPEAQKQKLGDPDAFKTEGGRAATGNQGAIRDARGEYLDHRAKFEAARAEGDLKTGGKSVVKAGSSEAVGPQVIRTDDPALAERFRRGEVSAQEFQRLQQEGKVSIGRSESWQQRSPEAERLYQESRGLKNYQDTHEAGITRGDQTPEAQRAAVQDFQRRAGAEMDAIGQRATVKGEIRDGIRQDIQRGYAQSPDPEIRKLADEVGAERARVRDSNQAAANKLEQAQQRPSAQETYERGWKEGKDGHGGAGAGATAAAEPGLIDKVKAGATAADNTIAGAMGVGALPANASGARVALNVGGEKLLQGAGYVGAALVVYETGKESFEGGRAAGEGIQALAAGDTDKAAQKFGEAADKGKNVGIIVGMTAAAQAMPQTAAMLGAGAAGYAGGRYVLESTETGRQVDKGAADLMDRGMQAGEGLVDAVRGIAGYQTSFDIDRERLDKRQQAYLNALERGDIKLRDGTTVEDLMDKVKEGDRGKKTALDSDYQADINAMIERVPRGQRANDDPGANIADLTNRINDPSTTQKEREELQAQLLGELRTLQGYAAARDKEKGQGAGPSEGGKEGDADDDVAGGGKEPEGPGAGDDDGFWQDVAQDPDKYVVPSLVGPVVLTREQIQEMVAEALIMGEMTPEQAIEQLQNMGDFNRTFDGEVQAAVERGELPPVPSGGVERSEDDEFASFVADLLQSSAPPKPQDTSEAEPPEAGNELIDAEGGSADGGDYHESSDDDGAGALGAFISGSDVNRDRGGEIQMIASLGSVRQATASGDSQREQAAQVQSSGGAVANDIRQQSAAETASGDREHSWGNVLGNAVASGIQEGATQAATALGQAGADRAAGGIFSGGAPAAGGSAGGSSASSSDKPPQQTASAGPSGGGVEGHHHPAATAQSGPSKPPVKPPVRTATPSCPGCGNPMVFCSDGKWHCRNSAFVRSNPGVVRKPPVKTPPQTASQPVSAARTCPKCGAAMMSDISGVTWYCTKCSGVVDTTRKPPPATSQGGTWVQDNPGWSGGGQVQPTGGHYVPAAQRVTK